MSLPPLPPPPPPSPPWRSPSRCSASVLRLSCPPQRRLRFSRLSTQSLHPARRSQSSKNGSTIFRPPPPPHQTQPQTRCQILSQASLSDGPPFPPSSPLQPPRCQLRIWPATITHLAFTTLNLPVYLVGEPKTMGVMVANITNTITCRPWNHFQRSIRSGRDSRTATTWRTGRASPGGTHPPRPTSRRRTRCSCARRPAVRSFMQKLHT